MSRAIWRAKSVTVVALALSVASACSKKDKGKEAASASAAVTAPSAPPKPSYPPVPEPPKSLGKYNTPKDNPISPVKVALGHQLFFDKRLSTDGSVSCYSCHQNENGTGGADPTAIGARQRKLDRHSPTLWNVAFLPALYWDGRAPTLESQMKAAWAGGNMGMGMENLNKKAKEIAEMPEYKDLFEEAFPGEDIEADHVARAVASYERTLFCGETAYDKFVAGEADAMTTEQKAGWEVFSGKGACVNCHTPPFFSDAYTTARGAYHNAGVGLKGKKKDEIDAGRGKITGEDGDWAAFKTPSLRNITKSAPYFHDGSVAELVEVVKFMAGGGYKNKNLDQKFKDTKLSDEEIQSIVTFLSALDCDEKIEPPAGGAEP